MTMTRLQVADLLGDAFGPSGADTSDLLNTATNVGAPAEVLGCLRELPAQRFTGMPELWEHLEELPAD